METLARAAGPRGEIALRRRVEDQVEIDELVMNGAFAMDSWEPASERELARLAMVDATRRPAGRRRILVGGLGLGFTAAELVDLADRFGITVEIDVVEIEGCLIDWAKAGLTATLGRVATEPRVRLIEGDVAQVLAQSTPEDTGVRGPWDAILLDVDNGPDFLIHPGNAPLYTRAGLATTYGKLSPGGILAIWCQGQAPELRQAMSQFGEVVNEQLIPIRRGNRGFRYAIYSLCARHDAHLTTDPARDG